MGPLKRTWPDSLSGTTNQWVCLGEGPLGCITRGPYSRLPPKDKKKKKKKHLKDKKH